MDIFGSEHSLASTNTSALTITAVTHEHKAGEFAMLGKLRDKAYMLADHHARQAFAHRRAARQLSRNADHVSGTGSLADTHTELAVKHANVAGHARAAGDSFELLSKQRPDSAKNTLIRNSSRQEAMDHYKTAKRAAADLDEDSLAAATDTTLRNEDKKRKSQKKAKNKSKYSINKKSKVVNGPVKLPTDQSK